MPWRALEELVATLRARCPWDRKQTHATLMPHLLEESYEVLDALADWTRPPVAPRPSHLEEELGDLLFQIVFHARLAEEDGQFTLADVARGVHDKLVHRHPHVFGDVVADSADQVVTNWEAIKKQEKGRSSVTEGIPTHLPGPAAGHQVAAQGAVRSAWPTRCGSRGRAAGISCSRPTHAAVEGTAATGPMTPWTAERRVARQVGDLSFGVANLARRLSIDPEQALRGRALQYTAQIRATEAAGLSLNPRRAPSSLLHRCPTREDAEGVK